MERNRAQIISDLKSKLLKGVELETLTKSLEKDFNLRTINKMINRATKEIVDDNLNNSFQLFNEQGSLEIVEKNLKEKLPQNLITKVLDELALEVYKASKKKVKFELENSSIKSKELIEKYSNEVVTEKQINNWVNDHNYKVNTKNKEIKRKYNILSTILIILIFGPILDYFYHFSMFSRDPAPENFRIFFNIIFFLTYSLSAFLFFKKKYWARWISFLLYLFWFIISILIITHIKHISIINIVEVSIRLSILLILVNSAFWFNIQKTNKN